MEPASIRFNNPGAMWGKGNKIATKWGATSTTTLNDGLGQGNNIAFFPTKQQGACAQFDLWRAGYVNMTLEAADKKWSGGNSSPAYLGFLCGKVKELTPSTLVTPALLASPVGWQLMKFQAQWEAGQPYPLADSEWIAAQRAVFSGTKPLSATQKKATAAGAVVVATTATVGNAVKNGHHWEIILWIIIAGLGLAAAAWALVHFHHEKSTSPPATSILVPPVLPPAGGLK